MKHNRLISQNKVDIENILNEWFSSEVSSDDGVLLLLKEHGFEEIK